MSQSSRCGWGGRGTRRGSTPRPLDRAEDAEVPGLRGPPVRAPTRRGAPGSRARGAGRAASRARSSSVIPLSAEEPHAAPPRSSDRTDSTLGGFALPGRRARCASLLLAGCSDARPAWRRCRRRPGARTEVAGAPLSGRVAVVGGLDRRRRAPRPASTSTTRRRALWLRLPDLPEARHHAMAASRAGRLYVVGGYRIRGGAGEASDRAWVLFDRRWQPLPRLPEPRAAGGAAIVRNRLYVVGGVDPSAPESLAQSSRCTSTCARCAGRAFRRAGPRPREHLGVTALGGRIYAIGGRTAGLESNTARRGRLRHEWPGAGRALPDAPTRRGGNGATARRRPRRGRRRRGPRRHDRPG